MNKKKFGFAALLLASLLALAGIAFAHIGRNSGIDVRQNLHNMMEELMEKGNYDDLAGLREKARFNIIPFVDNEAEFKEMQEMHEAMEEFHGGYGYGMMGSNGMMGRELGGIGCH